MKRRQQVLTRIVINEAQDRLRGRRVRWPSLSSTVSVEAYADAGQAFAASEGADLLVFDTPGKVNDLMMDVARRASLLVLPTSPSLDDLYPSVLVYEALQNVGSTRDRLTFALCRVLSQQEGERARIFLVAQGYTALTGHLYEHLAYRDALNTGRGATETQDGDLNSSAELVMNDVLQRVGVHRENLSRAHSRNVGGTRPAS